VLFLVIFALGTFQHADHWHPFLDPDTQGNNLNLFPAPEPEDFLAATNTYLEIVMTATDNIGIQSTVSRNVYPMIIEICIDSEPQGLEIFVDQYPIQTPMRITSWVNHDLQLRTDNAQETLDGVLHFSAWSDAVGSEERTIRLRRDNMTDGVVAMFCTEGDTSCVQSSRGINDTVVVARCPTDSPTVTPSAMASSYTTVSPTDSPTTTAPSPVASSSPTVGLSGDSRSLLRRRNRRR
jgi:hypothetical protein